MYPKYIKCILTILQSNLLNYVEIFGAKIKEFEKLNFLKNSNETFWGNFIHCGFGGIGFARLTLYLKTNET